jgi:N-acetylneuraminic acid mutarotase
LPAGLILMALAVSLFVTQAALAASWTPTGSMQVARFSHTATLLSNGKVLVAGGGGSTYALQSAALYDPATGSWTGTGSMQTACRYHTGTLLPNGKVLVAGGYNSTAGYLQSAALYDPATEAWSLTGSMQTARSDHTATLLPNGKVLVAGGYNSTAGYLRSAELYDPATGTWTGTELLQVARRSHTATLLPYGKVLVAGGYNSTTTSSLQSAEFYDPATEAWTATGSMQEGRRFHTATLLPNGKVLVAGGTNFIAGELYSSATEAWTATGFMLPTQGRYSHTATLLPNGKVLVAGGTSDLGIGNYHSSELYDPATDDWSQTGSMQDGRKYHTATLLPNGKVLVAGGYNRQSAELYDPDAADLSVSTTSLSPSCQQGQNAASQIFEVWNSGGGTLTYTTSPDAAWLSCDPTSGTSTGEHDAITVNYASSGLAAGTYNATITISGASQTKNIAVTLTVTVPPSLSISRTSLTPSCLLGQNAASQTFEVWNSAIGSTALNYTISPDAAWLSCAPASGASTGEHDAITVNYASSGLAAGTYNATITVSGASQTKTIGVTLTVFGTSVHIITANTGANGSISPSGAVQVNHGADQTFSINPETGYHVADVLVDGISAGAVPSYTFTNVTADHTIAASFAINTYTIAATAGPGGSISPAGAVQVNHGSSRSFTITPGTNHNIKSVLVDGGSVGPVSSYTFNSVTENHNIAASFVSTILSILTDKGQVRVPPGKTAPLKVKLSDAPQANVTVTVARKSGSPALSIQGAATLTFTPANWNIFQTVQIAATADRNDMNATAVFELSAPGLTGKQITAIKGDLGNIVPILELLLD